MLGTISEEYVARHPSGKKNKIICPSCNGNDLAIKQGSGFAHCFECGESYRIGERSERQHVENNVVFDIAGIQQMYGEAAEYYHSCITTEHRRYLASRGINDKAIELFKIGFCPPSSNALHQKPLAKQAGIASSWGAPWLANRITFPYISADGRVTDLRGRAISPDSERKYLSLFHRSDARGAIYPFNYDRSMERAMKSGTLIITEGEIKAVVADMHDFAITALPGMTSYRKALISQPGIRLVVIYDSSVVPEDRVRVDRALYKLSQHLPKFSVVTLPLFGHAKMDVDLFILEKGADRFRYMIDNAVDYSMYKKLRAF